MRMRQLQTGLSRMSCRLCLLTLIVLCCLANTSSGLLWGNVWRSRFWPHKREAQKPVTHEETESKQEIARSGVKLRVVQKEVMEKEEDRKEKVADVLETEGDDVERNPPPVFGLLAPRQEQISKDGVEETAEVTATKGGTSSQQPPRLLSGSTHETVTAQETKEETVTKDPSFRGDPIMMRSHKTEKQTVPTSETKSTDDMTGSGLVGILPQSTEEEKSTSEDLSSAEEKRTDKPNPSGIQQFVQIPGAVSPEPATEPKKQPDPTPSSKLPFFIGFGGPAWPSPSSSPSPSPSPSGSDSEPSDPPLPSPSAPEPEPETPSPSPSAPAPAPETPSPSPSAPAPAPETGDPSPSAPEPEPEMPSPAPKSSPTPSPHHFAGQKAFASLLDGRRKVNGVSVYSEGENEGAVQISNGARLEISEVTLTPSLVKKAKKLFSVTSGTLVLTNVNIHGEKPSNKIEINEARTRFETIIDSGDASNIILKNCTIASATGTAIKLSGHSALDCTNCVFRGNSGQKGGALYVLDSTARLQSSRFFGNSAGKGGAIYVEGSSCNGESKAELVLLNTKFERNKADSGGSVAMHCGKYIQIVSGNFSRGVSHDGGAVYIDTAQSLEITDSNFGENKADQKNGGALHVRSVSQVTVQRSYFRSNSAAQQFSGAVHLVNIHKAKLMESVFRFNSASEGGAITLAADSSSTGSMNVDKCTFEDNEAKGRGGALLLLKDSKFLSDSVDNDGKATVVTIVAKSKFIGNVAGNGGAVLLASNSEEGKDLKLIIRSTEFKWNAANKQGGALYCGNHASISVTKSSFKENTAHTGTNGAKDCSCNSSMDDVADATTQKRIEDNLFDNVCASSRGAGSTQGKHKNEGALVFLYVAVAVLSVFFVLAVVLIFRKRRSLLHQPDHGISHRTLSTFVGPNRSTSVMSVPFLPDDVERGPSRSENTTLLRSSTFGEVDYLVPTSDINQIESFDQDVYLRQEDEATLAQMVSADSSFFSDYTLNTQHSPRSRRLSDIPEIPSTSPK